MNSCSGCVVIEAICICLFFFFCVCWTTEMYNNVGAQPGVPIPPATSQPNPFGNTFYGAGSGLIRGGLGAYGEKILGSSSEYVQSNVSSWPLLWSGFSYWRLRYAPLAYYSPLWSSYKVFDLTVNHMKVWKIFILAYEFRESLSKYLYLALWNWPLLIWQNDDWHYWMNHFGKAWFWLFKLFYSLFFFHALVWVKVWWSMLIRLVYCFVHYGLMRKLELVCGDASITFCIGLPLM